MWFGSINELQCMNSHGVTALSLDFLEKNKAYYANTIPLLRISSNLKGIYYSFVVKKKKQHYWLEPKSVNLNTSKPFLKELRTKKSPSINGTDYQWLLC